MGFTSRNRGDGPMLLARHIVTVALRGSSGICVRKKHIKRRQTHSPLPLRKRNQGQGPDPQEGQRVHKPVMVEEVLDILAVGEEGIYVDGTLGSGGHAEAILKKGGSGVRLLGIDRDPEALLRASRRLAPFGDRVILRQGSYSQVEAFLKELGYSMARGVLLDLGASYEQLTSPTRGFSFRESAPLDMRFDPESSELTAHRIVNFWPQEVLEEIIRRNSQEPMASRIARSIVRNRPIRDTQHLAQVIARAVPRKGRIHPATRVFQALRIEVNQELDHLKRAMDSIPQCLQEGGRMCVISYHSLEDGIVKRAMRALASGDPSFHILTPKPLRPRTEEVAQNPSARSARLRALERKGYGG